MNKFDFFCESIGLEKKEKSFHLFCINSSFFFHAEHFCIQTDFVIFHTIG
jgi:hypothetical protein